MAHMSEQMEMEMLVYFTMIDTKEEAELTHSNGSEVNPIGKGRLRM